MPLYRISHKIKTVATLDQPVEVNGFRLERFDPANYSSGAWTATEDYQATDVATAVNDHGPPPPLQRSKCRGQVRDTKHSGVVHCHLPDLTLCPVPTNASALRATIISMRLPWLVVFAPVAVVAQSWPVNVTSEDGPERSLIVHIRNDFTVPLTASAVSVEWGNGQHHRTNFDRLDTVLSPMPHEGKAPGQITDARFPQGSAQGSHWRLVALIFADGTTFGDADMLRSILTARANVHKAVGKAISILSANHDCANDFRKWLEEGTRPSRSPVSPEFNIQDRIVPQAVIRFCKEGKTETEMLQLLGEWRNRLAQSKPAISPAVSAP